MILRLTMSFKVDGSDACRTEADDELQRRWQ